MFSGYDGTNSLDSVECYDASTNTWTEVAPMNTKRLYPGIAVADGKMYVVGGYDFSAYSYFSSMECYDPVTNTWTDLAPMLIARINLSVAVVEGKLYAVGGKV